MDYFQNAIQQIREATAELKSDNDAAEARQYQEWAAEQRTKMDAIIKMNQSFPCPRVVRDYQNDQVKAVS